MMFTQSTKGFTLIELLVVIAIIGILASTVLASLQSARVESRDTQRVSEVKELMKALEIYRLKNNGYPCSMNIGDPNSANINCLATDNNRSDDIAIKPGGVPVAGTSPANLRNAISYLPSPDVSGDSSMYYSVKNTGVNNRADRTGYTIVVGREDYAGGATLQTGSVLRFCKVIFGTAGASVSWGPLDVVTASIPDCIDITGIQ